MDLAKSLLGGQDDNPVETAVGEEVMVHIFHADARCAVFIQEEEALLGHILQDPKDTTTGTPSSFLRSKF